MESTQGEEGKRLSCDLQTRVYTCTCKHMTNTYTQRARDREKEKQDAGSGNLYTLRMRTYISQVTMKINMEIQRN